MIQAVLFDLFETLVTESGASVRRAGSLAQDLGVDQDAYRSHWRSRRFDVVLGRSSFRETLAQIAGTLGTPPNDGLLDRLRSERVAQKAAVLRTVEPDVLAALSALRAAGLRLGVVTNCFAEDVAAWESSSLHTLFDATVFSCAVGLAKPDPEIYLLACRQLHVPPDRTLFIGDGGDNELVGARTAGLRAERALWFLSRWPHAAVGGGEPGLRPDRAIVEVEVDLLQVGEVEHDPALGDAVSGAAVTPAPDGELETGLAREGDDARDVVRAGDPDDERRTPVDPTPEDGARLVVVGIARRDDATADRAEPLR